MKMVNEITDEKKVQELVLCSRDPWYYMTDYVKTLHKVAGAQPFPQYEYLKDLAMNLMTERLILILKSRQMVITWTAVSFALWEVIFRGAGDVLFISKREIEAHELISRAKFIYRNLPVWMRPELTSDNKSTLEFGNINSRIFSVPNSANAVRTYSPRRIIWDEMPHAPFDEEIWEAVVPVIEKDGSFVGLGTPNGPFTKHAELWLDKKNEMKKISVHYSLNPTKDTEWLKSKSLLSEEAWAREQELDITSGTELIYTTFSEKNVCNEIENYKKLRIFRFMDFGFHTPVVLWGYLKCNMELVIFHEWYGEDNTIGEMAEAIMDVDELLGLTEDDIEMSYGDPAGESITDEGLNAAEKIRLIIYGFKFSSRKSNIMPGIDVVRTKIQNAEGVQSLKVYGKCKRLISDVRSYRKAKNSELPVKDNVVDHGCDSLRYGIIGIFGLFTEITAQSILMPKVAGLRKVG